MKEINVNDFENLYIGQVEDPEAATGCTVLISPGGMPAGIDVRGGGPALRDSALLDPLAAAHSIHAVVLAGGSAFGLDAAGGVMQYLEEQGVGYNVGVAKVPLVCQADIFDLSIGDKGVRPDKAMGYAAAKAAYAGGTYRDGNYGAGCGATIGKTYGISRAMKSGIGSYALQLGELKIGAIAVVNSFGDIKDKEGKQIGGLLNEEGTAMLSSVDEFLELKAPSGNKFIAKMENTTISAVFTNAKFDKAELCKIAACAQDGYARAINPVHTSADGDTVFALSVGDIEADHDLVCITGAEVVREAIVRAVKSAEPSHGFKASRDVCR